MCDTYCACLLTKYLYVCLYIFCVGYFLSRMWTDTLSGAWCMISACYYSQCNVQCSVHREKYLKQTTLLKDFVKNWDFRDTTLGVMCRLVTREEVMLFLMLKMHFLLIWERVSKLSLINFRRVELLNMPWDSLTVHSSALIKHLQLIINTTKDIQNNYMKSIANVN